MRLQLSAVERRNPELAKQLAALGKVHGSYVELELDEYRRLDATHAAVRAHTVRCLGLGDLVACLAWPIAKPLKLTGCEPCNRRRRLLNRWLRICSG